MAMTYDQLKIPLRLLPSGTVRVTGTGVTLEAIVVSHRAGHDPKKIQDDFPALDLADIYLVIGYCLRHKDEIDQYMKEYEEDWDKFEEEMLAEPGAREYYERLWEAVRQEELAEQETLAKLGEGGG